MNDPQPQRQIRPQTDAQPQTENFVKFELNFVKEGTRVFRWMDMKVALHFVLGKGYYFVFKDVSEGLFGISHCSGREEVFRVPAGAAVWCSMYYHFVGFPSTLSVTLVKWSHFSVTILDNLSASNASTATVRFQDLENRYTFILETLEDIRLLDFPKSSTVDAYRLECEEMKEKWKGAMVFLEGTEEMNRLIHLHDDCLQLMERWMPWIRIHQLCDGDDKKLKTMVEELRATNSCLKEI